MDISSILPMLMQQKGGNGTDDRTSAMINALSSMRQPPGAADNTNTGGTNAGGGFNPASILSALNNGGNGKGGLDPAALLSTLGGGGKGAQNPNLNLVNLLSTLNKSNRVEKRPRGMKPVKGFIPDEILGKIVKYFNN